MVVLRKRKLAEPSTSSNGLQALLDAAADCKRLLIFTGSGLSATSGMSTFSTRGGLYERAQKRFAVQDGKKLFTYAFFEKQRLEAMAFFADIYAEAKRAKPSLGHKALAGLAAQGKLQRHYTLNIDGLAQAVGLSTWHPDRNPTGETLEMHGSIREMVCPECGHVTDLTAQLLRAVRAKKALPCPKCHEANLRMRIMLYDDGEADVITPDDVFDVLEEDVRDADMILWETRRLETCKQAVINLSEDCLWNLLSSCSNVDNLNVMEVLASADEAMTALAQRLAGASPCTLAPGVPCNAPAPSKPASSLMQTGTGESHSASAPAARRHAGAPVFTSAPAVLDHSSAPTKAASTLEQSAGPELHPISVPSAGSEQAALPLQPQERMIQIQKPQENSAAAADLSRTVAEYGSPSQASAAATEAGGGSRMRPMSSAALSESPAALAMPARGEASRE